MQTIVNLMNDFTKQKELKYQYLMELHRHLIGIEKIEIESRRLTYSIERTIEVYRDYFERTKDHIVLIQAGQIKHISPSLAGLLGYSKKLLIGEHFAAHVLAEEIPKLAQIYRDRLLGKNAPDVYSTVLRHRTGKSVLIKIIAGLSMYLEKPTNFAVIKELSVD